METKVLISTQRSASPGGDLVFNQDREHESLKECWWQLFEFHEERNERPLANPSGDSRHDTRCTSRRALVEQSAI